MAEQQDSTGFSIAKLSIEKPVLTWLIILGCLLGGLVGFSKVGRLEDPAFTIKEAVIFTAYPGASALEVEAEVTEYLETQLQQMPQLKEVRSESSPGMSEIHVEMQERFDGTELPQIWDELRKRLRDASGQLPPGVQPSRVFDDFGDVYGIFYAVTAPGYSDREIRDMAKMLRRELLVVDGVAKVDTTAVPEERIYIEISQQNLSRLGLPFQAVLSTLANENAVVTAGEIPSGDKLIRLSVPQGVEGTEAIESLLISPQDSGQTLRLSDIARVVRTPEERAGIYVRHNGERAFTLGISGLSDANIVDVGNGVEARLKDLEADLPVGVEIHPIYEQHRVVDEAINGFLINLLMSVAIVIGVLCLTMGWRAGMTVGAVLFLTVCGTIFFMYVFDITMQRISLGALIIAMGMLVDNAIVVTEGIQISVQRGERRLKAAVDAVGSTKWPLLGATIIGIMAFSGIGLSPDATGEFLFSLFAVIGISLMLSWVLAITVTPMIAHYLFKSEKGSNDDPYKGWMYTRYRDLLVAGLRARWLTMGALLVITVACFWGFGFVRNSFFPNSNTPLFYVNLQLPQGSDILDTDAVMEEIGDYIAQQPETVTLDAFTGRGATRFMLTYATEQPNPAYGQFIVRTADLDTIPALEHRILDHVRANYPNLEIRTERLVFGPPSGAQLEARFSGPDPRVLRELGEEAMARLNNEANVRDIRMDWRNRALSLRPEINIERARTAGVTREDIAEALRFATEGVQVGSYREDEVQIPIIARAPDQERNQPETLDDRLIWSPAQNAYVPINQVVGGFKLVPEEVLIQRRDRVRTLTVQANPQENETAMEGFARFSGVITQMELPHGYHLEWGGEYEASSEAQASLGSQLPLSFLVMLAVSFLLFLKVRQPLIIWAIVPMSICGVTIGLLVTNVPFSFTALLGFLSLSGMLIKNAIVLVDEVDQRIARGDDGYEAIRDGAVSRLRPVLLAAGTTILGMTPLLFDAFFAGMAVTIIGGLTFASILTMIAAPVLYALFFKIRPPARG
ncbi:efflux RND transporter permease subunit [Woodsholea maritima]|uniref:efflux RND transporter permease subunit n=1 Tax=Woodsholea maritima TaxID=240237 RepID=UPI000369654E|nr:efflux RND transporter permease subunit [Woodsholea maritima]